MMLCRVYMRRTSDFFVRPRPLSYLFSVLFKYLNIIEFGALMNLDQREEVTRKYRVISLVSFHFHIFHPRRPLRTARHRRLG